MHRRRFRTALVVAALVGLGAAAAFARALPVELDGRDGLRRRNLPPGDQGHPGAFTAMFWRFFDHFEIPDPE